MTFKLLTIRLPNSYIEEIKTISLERQTKFSEILRLSIQNGLATLKEEKKERRKRDEEIDYILKTARSAIYSSIKAEKLIRTHCSDDQAEEAEKEAVKILDQALSKNLEEKNKIEE